MSSRNSEFQDNKNEELGFLEKKVKTRFQVICKIGSGAYGHVWKVRCKDTGSVLAIKKVFLAFQNQTDAQRVYREISLLSKISHQNVVKLKEVIASEETKDIYLLLEYMESDVFMAIKNRVLDKIHKKYIVYQLASALNYLHSGGVLHRDLKPSNILINSCCQIKICDFGLSRTLASQLFNKPIMTEFVATRWYRAPEVLLGSKCYSTKSDMWSLGCLIYELYSRRTLLPGQNTIDQITKMVEFKGRPTKEQIFSFNAAKAAQIMCFFEIEKRPTSYYYDYLQCEGIKQILNHLFQYNPQQRWSAKQLMQCPFLEQFRDTASERVAQTSFHLNLNDNRRYKSERYKQQIWNLGNKEKGKFSPNSAKRLLAIYRNNTYFSLHASTNNLKQKLNTALNTTLRGRDSKWNKHQSKTVSPVKYRSTHKDSDSSVYFGGIGSVLLKAKEKNSHKNPNESSFSKRFSRKRFNYNYNSPTLKERQSPSKSKIILKMKEQVKNVATNKQNNENRLRTLKKQKFKHYRQESQKK